MSILTDNLWPKDIPESGRLIALVRMLQIAGVDMSLIQAVEQMDAEIERLNDLVAMQAEALKAYMEAGFGQSTDIVRQSEAYKMASKSISASSDTVSAYKREVQAGALEKAADMFDNVHTDTCPSYSVSKELIKMASELRAKGE